MPRVIKHLPQNLINQIAAGEVVERPASVLKELVENALDAGATRISVQLAHGGKSLIRVTDNGKGMDKDDLALCLERHATSKLPDEDLNHINFFGFRGEALPAIASISRVTITSKEKGASQAWTIQVNGGEKESIQPAAGGEGTCIEVRDLFYATPARLKFLKGDSTEFNHCQDMLLRLALVNPEVTFSLRHNDRDVNRWLGCAKESKAKFQERAKDILGKEFAENALYFEEEKPGYRLQLLAGLPTLNRSQATHQYFFVNGRCIKDKIVSGAVRHAYQDYLAKDRHPMLLVSLKLPTEELDVNVHPAKTEVRFRQPQTVRHVIGWALHDALQQGAHQTSTTIANEMQQSFQTETAMSGVFDVGRVEDASIPVRATGTTGGVYHAAERPARSSAFGSKAASLFPLRTIQSVQTMAPNEEVKPASNTQDSQQKLPPLGLAVAQVQQTYIIAEAEDGMVIVDQHAAHERIVYEKLKSEMAQEGIARQGLLSPEVVELSAEETKHILEKKDELKKYGLSIEAFGKEGVLVREVPALLGDSVYSPDLIKDIASDLQEANEPSALKERIFHRLATKACHGSVRAGRHMTAPQMNALLRQVEATPFAGQCNHGRPTYVKLKSKDLEKLFGRS